MFDGLRRRIFALGMRLHRFSYRLWLATWAIICVLFIFEPQVEAVLQLLRYDKNFVSHFRFIENQYRFLIDSGTFPDVSVAHFHMLEIAAWLAMAFASTVLLSAAVEIWIYEGPYRILYERLAAMDRKKLIGAFVLLPVMGFALSSMPAQVEAKPFFLIMKVAPRVYFLMVAVTYVVFASWSSAMLAVIGWLVVWRG